MENANSTIVLKFGGASVSEPDRFSSIAGIIAKAKEKYQNVVVVVSAMGETTNQLTELAFKVHPNPPKREIDMLISVGERISISLLAMALAKIQIQAMSFTGSQSGIMTCSNHSDARIIDVKPQRILACLQQGKIAIVAGFQGVSLEKEITTLGRGGSDTTAVALAIALGAEKVIYYKDVEGIYEQDPKRHFQAKFFPVLDYQTALLLVEKEQRKVLHPRSILLAFQNGIPMQVQSFIFKETKIEKGEEMGTLIMDKFVKRKERPLYEERTGN